MEKEKIVAHVFVFELTMLCRYLDSVFCIKDIISPHQFLKESK